MITVKIVEDLVKEYNKTYFNNSLIINFPIKISKSKARYGFCKVFDSKDLQTYEILSFNISSAINFTKEKLRDTIVHELLHVKLYQDGTYRYRRETVNGYHGYTFVKTMNDMNEKYGLSMSVESVNRCGYTVEKTCKYIKNGNKIRFFKKADKLPVQVFVAMHNTDIKENFEYGTAIGTGLNAITISNDLLTTKNSYYSLVDLNKKLENVTFNAEVTF